MSLPLGLYLFCNHQAIYDFIVSNVLCMKSSFNSNINSLRISTYFENIHSCPNSTHIYPQLPTYPTLSYILTFSPSSLLCVAQQNLGVGLALVYS